MAVIMVQCKLCGKPHRSGWSRMDCKEHPTVDNSPVIKEGKQ